MKQTIWKWITRISFAFCALVLTVRLADWLAHRSGPLPTVPTPNGYDVLLAVADRVVTSEGDFAELGLEAARLLAQTNREPLARLREALRMETGVPLRSERGWVEKHAADAKKLKRLAVVLGAQAKGELADGNTNSATLCLLDTILLGQALARGGVRSDALNGLAVETVGTAALLAQLPHLDAGMCRSAAQELERSEARRDSPERILQTEQNWSAASFGLVSRVGSILLRKADARRRAEFTGRYHEVMRRTRRLMLGLAARAVEFETGQRVLNPSDLVPRVLKSVPQNPGTNSPMTDIPVPASAR